MLAVAVVRILINSSGEAIVRRLAQEDYLVTVNDIAANKAGIDKLVNELNEKHGKGTAIGVVADVTSSSDVQNLIKESVEKLGDLTVFVANAGIAQVAPALEISDEDVQKMFNVNFVSCLSRSIFAVEEVRVTFSLWRS